MKNFSPLLPVRVTVVMIFLFNSANAQYSTHWPRPEKEGDELAFHKGCLIVSLTEGGTQADYGVKPGYVSAAATAGNITHGVSGFCDPLYIEYGFSKWWSAGVSLGTDLFSLDPARYYGSAALPGNVQVFMSEASVFLSHHYFIRRKVDLSDFVAVGVSGVTINGKNEDGSYQYNSDGYVVRAGTRGTYYFRKGLGVTGMMSAFTNYNSSKSFQGNTFGKNDLTQIQGYSWEVGLCYRFS